MVSCRFTNVRRFFTLVSVIVVTQVAIAVAAGEIRHAVTEDFTSLDPAKIASQTDRLIAINVYSRLIRAVPGSAEVEPDLAESWEVSEDGLTYTFKLRRGVTWQGGYGTFTSDDVRFTVEYHQLDSVASRVGLVFENIASVETPDENTVIFHLSQPTPALMASLAWHAGFIISRSAVDAMGPGFAQHPIGTGPFAFSSHSRGEEIRLDRYDRYFGAAPLVETIRIRVVPDESLAIQALIAGQIDAVPVGTIAGWRTVRGRSDVNLTDGATNWNAGIWINQCQPPLSDIRVRQALAHAIDYDAFYRRIDDYVTPNTSFLAFQLFGHISVPRYEYDIERARQLLDESGVDPSSLTIRFLTQDRFFEDVTLIIADYWRRLGLQVEVQREDRALVTERWTRGDYDAFINGLGRVDALELQAFFSSRYPQNPVCYSGADDLWEEQATKVDVDQRAALLGQIQVLVSRDVQMIPLGPNMNPLVTRVGLSGILTDNYLGVVEYREAHWLE